MLGAHRHTLAEELKFYFKHGKNPLRTVGDSIGQIGQESTVYSLHYSIPIVLILYNTLMNWTGLTVLARAPTAAGAAHRS
jgi:hypothetical protein